GSFEDLFCFNDEDLVRAIAQSKIPVVSAVGHEVDFTLADFVADYRAPTPSAGAEVISAAWLEVMQRILETRNRLVQAARRDIQNRKRIFTLVAARVISPRDRLRVQVQRCDELAMRLDRSIRVPVERARATLGQATAKLHALSPLKVLERGYTLVEDPAREGRVVRSAVEVKDGDILTVRFHDGRRTVRAVSQVL
ncbi:MAG: exodeoxyribonuclease VII large subunit, partial [Bdellovibrionota bacterium]